MKPLKARNPALLPLLLTLVLPACAEEEQGCPEPPQCPGGVLDENTNLCWQEPKAEGTFYVDGARSYCDDLVLDGRNDWHLPFHDEYWGLFESCGYTCEPCEDSEPCNTLFCPDTTGQFWVECPDLVAAGCVVVMQESVILGPYVYNENGSYEVRCVRENL